MSAPTTDVVDRLEGLAAHAPAGTVDPDAVWARGRRRQARGWVVAVVCAVVLAGMGAAAATPLARWIDPPIAAPTQKTVLPDVLRSPSGSAAAFPAAPGRLSAVGVGQRSHLVSSSASLWGVSAATGESRWLELPDSVPSAGADAQLSADGRRLAYWITGEISGDPVSMGQTEDNTPVVGVAVMDLETGEVSRWEVESAHGLSVQGLVWADDVLWWQGGPVVPMEDGGATTAELRTRTWDVETDERTEVGDKDARAGAYLSDPGNAPGGFVTLPRSFRLERFTRDGEPTSLRMDLPPGVSSSAGLVDPEMAPDGTRVAALLVSDATELDDSVGKRLLVGTAANGTVTLRRVEPIQAHAVLGWRSPGEVVLVHPTTGGDTDGDGVPETRELWLADLSDPDRPGFAPWIVVQATTMPEFAADAWTWTVVEAPDPPFAPDRRWFGSVAAALALVLVAGWRAIRSRRGHP